MENNSSLNNLPLIETISEPQESQTIKYSREAFLLPEGVKKRKDEALKGRLQALILERGMSEPEFFHKIGIIRQYWYSISWGIDECPTYLKIRIAKELGVDSRVIWEVTND